MGRRDQPAAWAGRPRRQAIQANWRLEPAVFVQADRRMNQRPLLQ
jgi:hypothetical protein